jgi:hypothetical protein
MKENGVELINFKKWLIANKGESSANTDPDRTDPFRPTQSGTSSRAGRREYDSQRDIWPGPHLHRDQTEADAILAAWRVIMQAAADKANEILRAVRANPPAEQESVEA